VEKITPFGMDFFCRTLTNFAQQAARESPKKHKVASLRRAGSLARAGIVKHVQTANKTKK